jgi:hypothetical protein
MGMCFVYSHRQTPELWLRRGVTLIGVFYLGNTCRFLIPYLIGYKISGDREHFLDPLFYRWLGNDVLLFAGLAIITIAVFRYLRLSNKAMFGIAALMTVSATLIGDLDTHSMFGNIFLGYFVGIDDATGYVISDFPLLTWLIFPVAGYVFGKVHVRVRYKVAFYRIISPWAMLVPLIYFPIGIFISFLNAFRNLLSEINRDFEMSETVSLIEMFSSINVMTFSISRLYFFAFTVGKENAV